MSDISKRPMGPWLKKLAIHRASQLLTEGTGGIAGTVDRIREEGRLVASFRQGAEFAFAAVDAVKAAPGGQAFGTEEQIAEMLCKAIDKKLAEQRKTMVG